MKFDWKPESKARYFKKAEAAVKEAGYEDILIVDRDKFATVKNMVKVYFQPIKRAGNTRRYHAARKAIQGVNDNSTYENDFGNRGKAVFIHPYILMDFAKCDQ